MRSFLTSALAASLLSLFACNLSPPLFANAAGVHEKSPSLAGPLGKDCLQGSKYTGEPKGKNLTIAGMPTYVSEASRHGDHSSGNGVAKVIMFFSDVFGPFYINNELLQDYFASKGFHVLGPDYFFGDPIQNHDGEAGFNQTEWMDKSIQQADANLPGWITKVKETYGPNAKYSAVGYCFGAPHAMNIGASDDVVATAFAHPAFLTEDHFNLLRKPLLMSCAETDVTFPTESLRRSHDLLSQQNATYHLQIFSNTTHGFATRSDPEDPNSTWAKEQSAKSVVEWFNRFSV
ncbi:alpha/beta-hydrolase [Coprinopsis marcescibilis]|uniref:Alpha/beta-hydrolase n=1 Tax=Coprinopsis marcescibilis TaxID=230819 RepID=A0A5C3KMI5_COPMA|nr:alpha/beta-hydrolase [Coprinopsis marcescibilis]